MAMTSLLLYAFLASTISSLGGLVGGMLLLIRESLAKKLAHYLISFAAGVLLGVTFLDLLPEAAEAFVEPHDALRYVLLGVVVFFLIERFIASFHSHEPALVGDQHAETLAYARPLVIVGDTVHNFIDGVVVAVAFLASVPLGVVTAVSVLFHELPHEIADFAILVRSGMPRGRVMAVNILSALVAPLGTVLAYFYATTVKSAQPYLLAIAAGNLLYVALADLVPHLHHESGVKRVVVQLLLFGLGIAVIFLLPGHAEA
ncbi:MAG: ZIP family metal transporter [Candidatus Kerfeldbacteria bacterium]|nr:ZIP family metal transporter [Candidatus Kerfeldbacteria bacterium]